MTPLQKIALGLVIVLLPAYFPADPDPAWAYYDALPDPLGWLLVVAGVWALGRAGDVDLGVVRPLALAALLVSIPMWFPQLNHLLVPRFNPGTDISGQWFVSLPQTLFGFFLARQIGRAGHEAAPRDGWLAGRFGMLSWGYAALAVLPVIAYGGGVEALVTPTLVLIGVVNLALIYYLFAAHRRPLLGGPGPRDYTQGHRGETQNRPPS